MKKTLLAAVIFLGFTTAVFAQAEGRCMKCKKQVEIQNGEEIVVKNGIVSAVTEVSPSQFIYILQADHDHPFISVPTTAQIAMGENASLMVHVQGWDYVTKDPIINQVYERIKRELSIERERRSGGF